MPRRKPARRKRMRRGTAPPVRPAAPPVAVAPPSAPEHTRERSATRFSIRDYAYVRRDIRRIVLLAGAILVLIVVLSFFLP